jgi:SNF2 family DNA or RNA helicase
MPHQKNAVDWLRERNWRGLLFMDVGIGKTYSAYEAVRQQGFQKTLIIATAGKKNDWLTECQDYLGVSPTVIEGDKENRKKLWLCCESPIVICNYEQVLNDFTFVSNNKWHTIIIDECQKIKSPTAKWTKAIKKLPSVSRIALSATPAPNKLHEMWSVADWIRPGILGKNFYEFKSRFCKVHPVFPSQITGYYDENFIFKTFASVYIRIEEKDTNMKLPPLIETIIYVDLTEEERKRYNKLRDDLILEIEGEKDVSVPNVVSKILRLRQLLDYPRSLGLSGQSTKERALEDWVKQTSSRYLLFTEWSTKAKELQNSLSIPCICGDTPQAERVRILQEAIQQHFTGLVATSALEEGFNCQWADAIVHYSLPWNYARYCQRNGRARRKGRTEPVESVVFLVRGTLDEWLWQMIQRKKKLQESLSVDDLKSLLQ